MSQHLHVFKNIQEHYLGENVNNVMCIDKVMRFDVIPKVLVFLYRTIHPVSKKDKFRDMVPCVVFGLKGVVYYGDFHYTARICTGGSVWFMMAGFW